jgi:hypothetical protein
MVAEIKSERPFAFMPRNKRISPLIQKDLRRESKKTQPLVFSATKADDVSQGCNKKRRWDEKPPGAFMKLWVLDWQVTLLAPRPLN